MKPMLRRLALYTLILSLPLLSGAGLLSCADPAGSAVPAADGTGLRADAVQSGNLPVAVTQNPQKDETVYVSLAHSGTVEQIEVVNRLYGFSGTRIEPDPFLSLESLTDGIQPVRTSGHFQVECPAETDVYLQGTLDPATSLPFDVEITWLLDGQPAPAEQLAGATGEMDLRLSISPGPESMRAWTSRLLLQVTITLDLNHTRDIRAEGAVRLVAGSSCTLSYSLPGSLLAAGEAVVATAGTDPGTSPGTTWEISFSGTGFQMPGITLTALPLTSGLLGTGGLAGGLRELQEGAASLADSGSALAGGLDAAMAGMEASGMGPGAAATGLPELAAGADALARGQQTLAAGLAALAEQVDRMAGKDDTPLRSFASPDGTAPATLQFLYRTSAIEPHDTPDPLEPDAPEPDGIWERLLDLFRK